MRKKILVVFYNMLLGGSTTSLLSFLKALDKKKYEIDLLLYKNEGPFLLQIPEEVTLLPEAFRYNKKAGKIIKVLKSLFCGYIVKAWRVNKGYGKQNLSEQIMADFQALQLSRKLSEVYDYAVGFMEGWSDRYVAHCVSAKKKYGWLHSTFVNIAPVPKLEEKWMENVDKIVCVSEKCRMDFCKDMPNFSNKSIVIENILDEDFIKNQSTIVDQSDNSLKQFLETKSFKIISVCRISIDTKGLDRVVLCAKRLKDMKKDFIWYIIGDGNDKEELKTLVREADLEEQIILPGKRNNPYPFIKNADIMCMPSRWEGKPMTVTEAMILETPCIVTEYLSAKEQIKNGVDGLVVENNDISIQNAVLKCMENREVLESLRSNLRVNKYGNSTYINYIEKTLFS